MNLRIQLACALALVLLGSCSGKQCPTADACVTRSATQCVGDLVQTCQPDTNCCLTWTTAEACDGGQACSSSANACPGANACAGKECGFADSCGVGCASGSTCSFIGCAGNFGACNQACSVGCVNSDCLEPCMSNCSSLHSICCSSYSGQYPQDKCL